MSCIDPKEILGFTNPWYPHALATAKKQRRLAERLVRFVW